MTAYVTRAPLQLINNPHIMSEASRGHGRRTSARLADKEDAPYINGIGNDSEPVKPRQNVEGKQGKGKVNGASTKPTAKRKPGEQPLPLRPTLRLLHNVVQQEMASCCALRMYG